MPRECSIRLRAVAAPDRVTADGTQYGHDVLFRETALHKAAKNGRTKTVEALLKKGADPGLKDDSWYFRGRLGGIAGVA